MIDRSWFGPRNPNVGPKFTAGSSSCAAAPFIVGDGGVGVADVDLGAVLSRLGNPVSHTFFGQLNIISIVDVDGEFPVAQTHPVALWVDGSGFVQVSGLTIPVSPNITNPAAATAQVQGGTANYATNDSNAGLVLSVTGTDRVVTVTYTPPLGVLHSGAVELCLGVAHDAIPA